MNFHYSENSIIAQFISGSGLDVAIEDSVMIFLKTVYFYMRFPSAVYSDLLHTLKHFSLLFFDEPSSYYFMMTVSTVLLILSLAIIANFIHRVFHVRVTTIPLKFPRELRYTPRINGYWYQNIRGEEAVKFIRNRSLWCDQNLHRIIMNNLNDDRTFSLAISENTICGVLLDGKMLGSSMNARFSQGWKNLFFRIAGALFIVSIPANTLTLSCMAYAASKHSIADAASRYYVMLTMGEAQHSLHSLGIYMLFPWIGTIAGLIIYLLLCKEKRQRLSNKLLEIPCTASADGQERL